MIKAVRPKLAGAGGHIGDLSAFGRRSAKVARSPRPAFDSFAIPGSLGFIFYATAATGLHFNTSRNAWINHLFGEKKAL